MRKLYPFIRGVGWSIIDILTLNGDLAKAAQRALRHNGGGGGGGDTAEPTAGPSSGPAAVNKSPVSAGPPPAP